VLLGERERVERVCGGRIFIYYYLLEVMFRCITFVSSGLLFGSF